MGVGVGAGFVGAGSEGLSWELVFRLHQSVRYAKIHSSAHPLDPRAPVLPLLACACVRVRASDTWRHLAALGPVNVPPICGNLRTLLRTLHRSAGDAETEA